MHRSALKPSCPRVGRACRALWLLVAALLPAPWTPTVRAEATEQASGRIVVHRYALEFAGGEAASRAGIPLAVLTAQLADLTGRALDADALQEAAYRLTRWYRSQGYLQARVSVPDQTVTDGTVRLAIHEGYLGELAIEGLERLSADFVRTRITGGDERPVLHLPSLQAALARLNRHPRIARIDARLMPALLPGEARMVLAVEEAPRHRFIVGADNHRSPSVGANRLSVEASDFDLTGRRDRLVARVAFSPEPGEAGLSYRLPISADEQALEFTFSRSDNTALEAPFDDLDLTSLAHRYSLGFLQPLEDEAGRQSELSLRLERSRTETRLLDIRFPFSDDSADGLTRLHALRLGWERTLQTPERIEALRIALSAGQDTLGATDHDASPSRFFASLLLQGQWLWQPTRDSRWIVRSSAQWSPGRLVSGERFALGGAGSVRGYRENLFVRDNGAVASLEYRQAFARDDAGRAGPWQWATFIDAGIGWNRGGGPRETRSLLSAGVGLIWQPSPALYGELYWGQRLKQTAAQPHRDLQDAGLHFRLHYQL